MSQSQSESIGSSDANLAMSPTNKKNIKRQSMGWYSESKDSSCICIPAYNRDHTFIRSKQVRRPTIRPKILS